MSQQMSPTIWSPPPDPLLMHIQCFSSFLCTTIVLHSTFIFTVWKISLCPAGYHYFVSFYCFEPKDFLIIYIFMIMEEVSGEIWIIMAPHLLKLILSLVLDWIRWDLGNNHVWNRDQLQLKHKFSSSKRRWSHQSNPPLQNWLKKRSNKKKD